MKKCTPDNQVLYRSKYMHLEVPVHKQDNPPKIVFNVRVEIMFDGDVEIVDFMTMEEAIKYVEYSNMEVDFDLTLFAHYSWIH